MSATRGALAGIKVLDLTQMLAGPFGTMMLADQGADVIKIEAPEGDMSRLAGAFRAEDAERLWGGYFVSINRNKRSMVLDLKTPAGREILLKLVAGADVLVENFRLGVMDRLGLSYETLAAVNPKLVYAALRGFGDPRTGTSAYQNWPAFDVVAQAMGGMVGITGANALTPVKIGPGVGDILPGMFLAFGILAALRHAERSGQGQFVDVAMADSVLAVCERIIHQQSLAGVTPGPEGNQHPMLCPFGLFPAADGWVAIACPGDAFWVQLCEQLDLSAAAQDPRFKSAIARVRNRADVEQLLSEKTRLKTKMELQKILGGLVPFGPVLNAAEISADPHFRERGMIASLRYPGIEDPIEVAGVPVRLTQTPGGVHQRAPWLGEHTESVLLANGFSKQQIDQWHGAGAIRLQAACPESKA